MCSTYYLYTGYDALYITSLILLFISQSLLFIGKKKKNKLKTVRQKKTITHADDSRVSKAFSGICDSVSVFVCLSARQNQNRSNYNHQTCNRESPSRYLAHQIIFGRKVKSQGHRVTKCKKKHIEGDRVAGVSSVLYRVPSL